MKSTSGDHFIALDHVRALAALMVFVWHFAHVHADPVTSVALPPLSIFNEGHVGVSLFMTLSGYLFAKLLDGKRIRFHRFLWNRALRLLPLLVLVFAILVAQRFVVKGAEEGLRLLTSLPAGFVLPTWPNGGWSIATELHFYLLLPLLLALQRRSWAWLLAVVGMAILLRFQVYEATGKVQGLAYGTIVGRIDQFVAGMLAFALRSHLGRGHTLAVVAFLALAAGYAMFDAAGGYGGSRHSRVWIVMPLLEGATFGLLIGWYDAAVRHSPPTFLSRALAKVGEYSYSIYLLHFFFFATVAGLVHAHVIDLSNFYVGAGVALVAFLAMIPIGWVSMRFVEAPFLRKRVAYVDRSRSGARVSSPS